MTLKHCDVSCCHRKKCVAIQGQYEITRKKIKQMGKKQDWKQV